MMNLLTLGLLVSSLAAAGVWSTHPHPDPPHHRLIVVQYERRHVPSDHPNSPVYHHHLIQEAKHKFQEAAALLPDVGQEISTTTPQTSHDGGGVKEKICDAYGACMDKLSTLVGNTKEGAMDAVNKGKSKVSERTTQLEQGVKDAVENASAAAGKAVEMAEGLRGNLSDIIQRARDVAYDAAANVGAPETARAAAAAAHLVAVAAAYGACVWVTFVSSHVVARAVPRQQFGVVQSRLYPVYFRFVAYCVGVALGGRLYLGGAQRELEVQGYNLGAVLGLVLVNMVYFEPKATRVMFERMKMEKEEGRGQDMATSALDQEAVKRRAVKLSQRLRRLNTYSSVLNVMVLMGLTWLLVDLARCLQVISW